jgi:hypothetical protein
VEEEGSERPLFKKDYFGLELTVLVVILLVVMVAFVLFMLTVFGEWTP